MDNSRVDLHLDRVVASQPEIGPTPPDGGYGWLIVASACIYNLTIPGLYVMYGLIILKTIRDEDHVEGQPLKVWDVDVALVPVLMVVIKLLLESWCRAVVKLFNMPRFMALSGLCLTVAGVLLSSFTTDVDENDHIVSVFSGIFIGSGCALTSQQSDVIVTHYFRDKLYIAQRLVKMAPTIGNCLVPVFIGFLSSTYNSDVIIMIYGAILMQNCFFLASYSRPIYIERVIRSTYNMLRDAIEDEDDVIYSNQNQAQSSTSPPNTDTNQEEPEEQIVVFDKNKDSKEIDMRKERNDPSRFSSDFSNMRFNENRFSSDFGTFDINSHAYRELDNIERDGQNPQPLYRETTVDAPPNPLAFAVNPEMTQGTARRTASLKKNVIVLANMLRDLNFYLYTMLHLNTTFSITMMGVFLPPLIWEQNPSLNIWKVSYLISIAHSAAFCFVLLCVISPQYIHKKSNLCALFCLLGAIGNYGFTLSSKKVLFIIWGMFASLSSAAAGILEQPLYNILNEFDTTATTATANTIVAAFLLIWSVVYNYEYKHCFLTASALQVVTGCLFLVDSFLKRR